MRIHHVADAGNGDHWQPGGALGLYRASGDQDSIGLLPNSLVKLVTPPSGAGAR